MHSATINLEAGKAYSVKMEYYEDGGSAHAYLGIPQGLQIQPQLERDLDLDYDGLTTLEEYEHGMAPNKADTDGDGFTDSENVALGSHDPYSDVDGDGYTAEEEILILGTNPDVFNSSVPGFALSEEWHNIGGSTLADLYLSANYPDSPNKRSLVSNLSQPANQRDNYGVQIQGYIVPDVTGDYCFQIACDDQGDFWLSSDERPKNVVRMAWADAHTNGSQNWTRYASQTSATVNLVAGEYYYFKLSMKEGSSYDYLNLRWHKPDGTAEIVSSPNLATFNPLNIDRDSIPDAIEQMVVDADANDSLASIWDVLSQDDFDLDGLSNLEEFRLSLSLIDPDTDGDGLVDSIEQTIINSDPIDAFESHDDVLPNADFDGDLMTNLQEQQIGLNPTFADAEDFDRDIFVSGENFLAPVLWLRADEYSAGSSVSEWQDYSGFDNHAVQSLAHQQPQFEKQGYLGHPSIAFDGLDDALVVASMSKPLTHYTVYLFIKVDDITTHNWLLGDADTDEAFLLSIADDGAVTVQTDATTEIVSPAGSVRANHWNLISFSYEYGIGRLSVNGQLTEKARMTQSGSWDSLDLGRSGSISGQIAEFIVFDYALTETDLGLVDDYVASKTHMGEDADLDGLLDSWELEQFGSLATVDASYSPATLPTVTIQTPAHNPNLGSADNPTSSSF